ncbi:protein-L-isoaspartate O-methyltransferase, partial [Mariniblastus sp.]|nr:protein-L-isoaspartate O-methyltransferase [Mariniblastus sp.]
MPQNEAEFEKLRNQMVEIAVVGAGISDERVLKTMRATPRHEFVPKKIRKTQSYLDAGVPIGKSQTISSPFIVAYMTQELDPQPTDKVLEIGTGSGYQAAILSPLVKEVYSIEIVEKLGKSAEKVLKKLKYDNVFTKIGDGYKGW